MFIVVRMQFVTFNAAVLSGSSDGADEENVKVGEQVHSDVPVILESGIDKPESPTDTEPYFVEYTPVAAKLSMISTY
jgi:hypothetical protein